MDNPIIHISKEILQPIIKSNIQYVNSLEEFEKIELAYKFFIENAKTQAVWLWLLETRKADWSWDTVKHLRWKLKKAFLELETKN